MHFHLVLYWSVWNATLSLRTKDDVTYIKSHIYSCAMYVLRCNALQWPYTQHCTINLSWHTFTTKFSTSISILKLVYTHQINFYFAPRRGAKCCYQCVCTSVCPRTYLKYYKPTFTKFSACVIQGCGSVLLWRQWKMLHTSHFADDATFSHNGPYGMWHW